MSNRYVAAVEDIIRIFGTSYRVVELDLPHYVWLEPVQEILSTHDYVKSGEKARYSLDWAEANAVPIKGAKYRLV